VYPGLDVLPGVGLQHDGLLHSVRDLDRVTGT
jgi:hypothetical protein